MKKNPAAKAWETMREKSPAAQAVDTKNRKYGAIKAIAAVLEVNFERAKKEYLERLNRKATGGKCINCGDSRPSVLQKHHTDPKKKIEVILCANCHDIVRRGTLADLKDAHKRR